jgi:hypothetical protein
MSAFSRYIGIDYSGAETPEASLKGEWQREPFGTYRPLSVRYLIVGGYAVSFHAQPRRRETRCPLRPDVTAGGAPRLTNMV